MRDLQKVATDIRDHEIGVLEAAANDLGYPHDVRKMVLDDSEGILQHMKSGATLVDHTTSSPELAEFIAE